MSHTIGIDIGGTFTDTVVVDDGGAIRSYKSLTTPEALVSGLLANIELASADAGVDAATFLGRVGRVAHGTTAATNAAIERRGALVGLLATRGFEDVIFQQRMMGMTAGLETSQLTDYALRSTPEPLVPPDLVFGVRERVDFAGRAIGPLREPDVLAAIETMRERGVEAVAIAFLWSFMHPEHERRAAELVREEMPDAYVTCSADLVPRIGEYERTATTVFNAFLGPTIASYTRTLEGRLRERGNRARVTLLDSNGAAMTPAEAAREPVRLLLSGPTGGLTASESLGERLGHRDIITFDMGGTSADVGMIVDGVPLQRHEVMVEQHHLLLSMADIRAIGAGGGSIATVEDGGYLRVGPQSAGSTPGPVCYGRGGTLPTVTDADLVLGILNPDGFLGGRMKLDLAAAEAAIERHVAAPLGTSVREGAAGIKRVVDARMADLLRTVTVQRGHDPRGFVLYAFGGAGGSHAPAFGLDLVGEVLVPAFQSVQSALGAAASELAVELARSEPMRSTRDAGGSDVDLDRVEAIFRELEAHAAARLREQGAEEIVLRRFAEIRFARQAKELRVPYPDRRPDSIAPVLERFLAAYAKRYGAESVPERASFELVSCAVQGRAPRVPLRLQQHAASDPDASVARTGERPVWDPGVGAMLDTPTYRGEALRSGHRIPGPAIVQYDGTTVALLSRQVATVDSYRNLSIRLEEDA